MGALGSEFESAQSPPSLNKVLSLQNSFSVARKRISAAKFPTLSSNLHFVSRNSSNLSSDFNFGLQISSTESSHESKARVNIKSNFKNIQSIILSDLNDERKDGSQNEKNYQQIDNFAVTMAELFREIFNPENFQPKRFCDELCDGFLNGKNVLKLIEMIMKPSEDSGPSSSTLYEAANFPEDSEKRDFPNKTDPSSQHISTAKSLQLESYYEAEMEKLQRELRTTTIELKAVTKTKISLQNALEALEIKRANDQKALDNANEKLARCEEKLKEILR